MVQHAHGIRNCSWSTRGPKTEHGSIAPHTGGALNPRTHTVHSERMNEPLATGSADGQDSIPCGVHRSRWRRHHVSERRTEVCRKFLLSRAGATFFLAWCLWFAQVVLANDYQWLWLHSAQLSSAFGIIVLMQYRWARRIASISLVVFAMSLPMLLFAIRAGFFTWASLDASPHTGLWFDNANQLAGSMVVSATAAAVILHSRKWLGVGIMLVSIGAALFVFVRGAALVAIVATCVYVATQGLRIGRTRMLLVSIAGIVMAIGVIAVSGFLPIDVGGFFTTIASRFDLAALFDSSDRGGVFPRLRAISAGLVFFQERPIAGIGYGSFPMEYLQRIDSSARYPFANAHNLFVHLLAESGVIGLMAWSLPIVSSILWVRGYWGMVLPLWVVVFLLNLGEVALFWSGVFYPYWIIIGWSMSYVTEADTVSPDDLRRIC